MIVIKVNSYAIWLPDCLYVSLGVATVGGCGVLLFWVFVGIPAFAVLFAEILLGYLVTSIVFNASPLGNLILYLINRDRVKSSVPLLFQIQNFTLMGVRKQLSFCWL